MTSVFKTPAGMVRTGMVIAVPQDHYRRHLEVDIVHHETHVDNGERIPVVRYTGWGPDGRVERGWARRSDSEVLVVEDRRDRAYQALSSGSGTTELL